MFEYFKKIILINFYILLGLFSSTCFSIDVNTPIDFAPIHQEPSDNTTGCGIIYVNSAADSPGDGSTWGTAYNNLSTALNASESECRNIIWVAGGTYYPEEKPSESEFFNSDRDFTFQLKNGVKLYGGFNGTEDSILDREEGNNTILSGDIGVPEDESDNVYHVLVAINDGSNTLIDGITISDGYAYHDAVSQGDTYIEYNSNYFYRNTGGGLYIVNSTIDVNNVIFENNSGYFGGAVGIDFGSVIPQNLSSDNSVNKSNSILASAELKQETRKNKSQKEKRKQVIQSKHLKNTFDQDLLNITNCEFRNNVAHYGGAIEIEYGDNISVSNSVFTNNMALYEGGAIYNEFSNGAKIDDCQFDNNICQEGGYGGAVSLDEVVNASISNSQFESNSVYNDGFGGAVSDYYSIESLLDNCTFYENMGTDGGFGGALYIGKTHAAHILKSTFEGNTVTEEGYGGAMYEDDAMHTLVDSCLFTANKAIDQDGEGGAIYIDSDSTKVIYSTFEENEALNGGAIYSYEKGLQVNNCKFKANVATNEGGAISGYYEVKVEASEFIANEAYFGGALYTYDNAALINCLIVHNMAQSGGGIYADSDYEISITNCTIANNESIDDEGSGVYNDGAQMNIANSILWNNSGTTLENQLFADGSTKVAHSFAQGGFQEGSIIIDEGDNSMEDPIFMDPQINGDYRLKCTSTAINKGDSNLNSSTKDLDGNERKVSNIDIGAYENAGVELLEINKIEGDLLVCPGDRVVYQIDDQECATNFEWSYKSGLQNSLNLTDLPSLDLDFSESTIGGILEVSVLNPSDTVKKSIQINLASSNVCALTRCSIDALNIDGEFMVNKIVPNSIQANISIKSNGTVGSGESYHFTAGNHILLEKFFAVEEGGVFLAEIDQCSEAIDNFNNLRDQSSKESFLKSLSELEQLLLQKK